MEMVFALVLKHSISYVVNTIESHSTLRIVAEFISWENLGKLEDLQCQALRIFKKIKIFSNF